MIRLRFILTAGAACSLVALAWLAVGCTGLIPTRSGDAPAAETSTTAPGWKEQIGIVTNRGTADLIPVEGAQAWLGGQGLQAYVDTQTKDEFIVDLANDMLLSYEPGTQIYQDPIDLPPYPGEPTREKMLAFADQTARKRFPKQDTSTMRRVARRRVFGTNGPEGDELEYQVAYRTYVNGTRMPLGPHFTILMPAETWKPVIFSNTSTVPSTSAVPAPKVPMLAALKSAAEAAQYTERTVKSLELRSFKGNPEWLFALEEAGHGAWVRVDALTGEVVAVDKCAGS